MKTIKLKKAVKKTTLFFVVIITFGLLGGKTFAQSVHPDSTTRMNPDNPTQNMSQPYQKPDTSGMKSTKSKLTQSQINKIVGNDTKAGKDSQGRQLYREASTGKQYYINNSGTKVYVK